MHTRVKCYSDFIWNMICALHMRPLIRWSVSSSLLLMIIKSYHMLYVTSWSTVVSKSAQWKIDTNATEVPVSKWSKLDLLQTLKLSFCMSSVLDLMLMLLCYFSHHVCMFLFQIYCGFLFDHKLKAPDQEDVLWSELYLWTLSKSELTQWSY